MANRSLYYPSLKDFTNIYYVYKKFGSVLIVRCHNDFHNTEDTITTLEIDWDDLMKINDHRLCELLSFKIESRGCNLHEQCNVFRLYDRKRKERGKICRGFNTINLSTIN